MTIDQILHGRFKSQRDQHVFLLGISGLSESQSRLLGTFSLRTLGALTTCNYFDVLGGHPAEGRGFLEPDCQAPAGNAVVVISDDLWQGTFASDASLVGKRIILNRTAYTVVGIAPPGFKGTEPIPSSFWVPITMQKALDPWAIAWRMTA